MWTRAATVASARAPARVPTRLGRNVRAVQPGAVTALVIEAPLIAALWAVAALGGVRLDTAAWIVGAPSLVVMNAALARGLSHSRAYRLGPADRVTLVRATLAAGIAALIADS